MFWELCEIFSIFYYCGSFVSLLFILSLFIIDKDLELNQVHLSPDTNSKLILDPQGKDEPNLILSSKSIELQLITTVIIIKLIISTINTNIIFNIVRGLMIFRSVFQTYRIKRVKEQRCYFVQSLLTSSVSFRSIQSQITYRMLKKL